ncbi:MAG: ribonuclease PH, partial [Gemmatimonadota bacterium]
WVALQRACARLVDGGLVRESPVREHVAAVSVGIVAGVPVLDLDYPEDSSAQVDMNVVATGSGRLVEVQGTAEGHPFTRKEMDRLIDLALAGVAELVEIQRKVQAA